MINKKEEMMRKLVILCRFHFLFSNTVSFAQ